ncbi:hypothetical protein NDU88_007536 [Pleurodeles waltl]|uniref:Uncharacterized protein n=1 Tax=Pleurodeles waltl TaxID=8319 RepID=A0AAV7U015_PLEWA|nr:hypothetical protein NDU88_007536 [Pleurodeles waltl]
MGGAPPGSEEQQSRDQRWEAAGGRCCDNGSGQQQHIAAGATKSGGQGASRHQGLAVRGPPAGGSKAGGGCCCDHGPGSKDGAEAVRIPNRGSRRLLNRMLCDEAAEALEQVGRTSIAPSHSFLQSKGEPPMLWELWYPVLLAYMDVLDGDDYPPESKLALLKHMLGGLGLREFKSLPPLENSGKY